MKPRTIAAIAFIAIMLICGGSVLRQWRIKHPPRPQETRGDGMRDGRDRDGRDRLGGESWRRARPVERTEAIACIDGQLDAFRKDDYVRAISYQSESLHSQFSSPSMFRTMILNQYPTFADAKKVVYGRAMTDESGRKIAIDIDLTGANHHKIRAQYQLVREKAGYRVMGVQDAR